MYSLVIHLNVGSRLLILGKGEILMKKSLVILVVMALLLSFALPVFAAKPDIPPGQIVKAEVQERNMIAKEERLEFKKDKENGAVFYDFYLSGDVMPVPPYGSLDIEDSDTMSKLIVNKPNGTNAVTATGVMKGLLPETEYMVYISNGYDPYYVTDEWNIVGDYVLELAHGTSTYIHDISITSVTEGVVLGTDGYPSGETYTHEGNVTGTFEENVIELTSVYTTGNVGYTYDIMLEIDEDGFLTGQWMPQGETAWRDLVVAEGMAVKVTEGNSSWTGYLNEDLIPSFTFMTDEEGHASWHVNIPWEAVECIEGSFEFSVWINSIVPGGTLLISETIAVECEE
jgi:hypothetical protein